MREILFRAQSVILKGLWYTGSLISNWGGFQGNWVKIIGNIHANPELMK